MAEEGRRDIIQDPLKGMSAYLQEQRGQIPVAPVQSPRRSDVSKVGNSQQVLGKLLGQGAASVSDWFKTKTDEWNLQGQMAYAEGKTEEEIAKSGNRYTMAGFMTMKAKTAYNEWYTRELQSIDESDKMLPSAEYQKKLSDTWTAMSEETAGSDPFTRNLLASMVGEAFPKLVAQQIKANNVWREKETFDSRTQMLVSEIMRRDPEETEDQRLARVEEFKRMNIGGLSPERVHQSNTEAMLLTLQGDDATLFKNAKFSPEAVIMMQNQGGGLPKGLIDSVMHQESRGKRYDKDGNILTSPKGAKGEMQVMDETNFNPGYGVMPAQDDSPEERARVGRDYLAAMYSTYRSSELAVMAYNAGPGALNRHIANVGNPVDGQITMEDFIKSFPYKETRDYVSKVMKGLTPEEQVDGNSAQVTTNQSTVNSRLIQELNAQGYTPAQIKSIANEYNQYQARRSTEFNRKRMQEEKLVLDTALQTGNLEGSLDMIAALKEAGGYTDAWAVQLANKAQAEVDKYAKEQAKRNVLETAIASDKVAGLTPSQQAEAIEINRKAAIGRVIGKGQNPESEEGQALIKADQRAFLIRNQVVDKAWSSEISSALAYPKRDKDGLLTQEVLTAYRDYVAFKEESNAGYASKYLSPEAKALVSYTETLDPTNLSIQQTLEAAVQMQEYRASPQYTPPLTISNALVNKAVADAVDAQKPGFWSIFTGSNHMSWWDLDEKEEQKAKDNPAFAAYIKTRTDRLLASPEGRLYTPESAVNAVMKQAQLDTALLPNGGVAFASRSGRTLRQAMGFADDTRPYLEYEALRGWWADNGVATFGPLYKGATNNREEQLDLYYKNNPDQIRPQATAADRVLEAAGSALLNMDAIQAAGRSAAGGLGIPTKSPQVDPNVVMEYEPELDRIKVTLMREQELEDGSKVKVPFSSKYVPAISVGNNFKRRQEAEYNTIQNVVTRGVQKGVNAALTPATRSVLRGAAFGY